MAYVAQLLPDKEEALVILEALTEFIANKGHNYDDPKVLAAEGIKADLIVKVREHVKRNPNG
jgi:hypothetical protein